jgi:hypothetical protein
MRRGSPRLVRCSLLAPRKIESGKQARTVPLSLPRNGKRKARQDLDNATGCEEVEISVGHLRTRTRIYLLLVARPHE